MPYLTLILRNPRVGIDFCVLRRVVVDVDAVPTRTTNNVLTQAMSSCRVFLAYDTPMLFEFIAFAVHALHSGSYR